MGSSQWGKVSPARAGMDPQSADHLTITLGFPRTRGDGPTVSGPLDHHAGFPPHARGWTLIIRPGNVAVPVSPARAGMDLLCLEQLAEPSRFPRTRGDGPLLQIRYTSRQEFPPHARGWTVFVGFKRL